MDLKIIGVCLVLFCVVLFVLDSGGSVEEISGGSGDPVFGDSPGGLIHGATIGGSDVSVDGSGVSEVYMVAGDPITDLMGVTIGFLELAILLGIVGISLSIIMATLFHVSRILGLN